MNKSNIPAPIENEIDGLALLLTIISVLAAILFYAFFKKTDFRTTIDIPLLVTCAISVLYALLVFFLCSRVKSSHLKIKRVEAMLETLLTQANLKNVKTEIEAAPLQAKEE